MKKGNLLLLMFLVVCWSCQNETEQNPKPETTPIEGETPSNGEGPAPPRVCGNEFVDVTDAESLYGVWKLVSFIHTGDRPDGMLTIDCSAYNILYEFKPNGILTVSDFDRPESVQVAGLLAGVHEAGDYPYSVGEFHDGRNLQIGSEYEVWWCRITIVGYNLEFDTAPVDGPVFMLVKVE